jgi:hypothetical protein
MWSRSFFLLEKPFSRSLLLEGISEAMEQSYRNWSFIKAQAGTNDFFDRSSILIPSVFTDGKGK